MRYLVLAVLVLPLCITSRVDAQHHDFSHPPVSVAQAVAIRFDPSFVPISDDSLIAMCNPRMLTGAAHAVAERRESINDAGFERTITPVAVEIKAMGGGHEYLRLFRIKCWFDIEPDFAKDAENAEVLSDVTVELVKRIEASLEHFAEDELEARQLQRRRLMERYHLRREEAMAEWAEAARELALAQSTGEGDIEQLRRRVGDLRQQLQQFEIEEIRLNARREAIERQIVRIEETREADTGDADASILLELERAIAMQEHAGRLGVQEFEAKIKAARADLEHAKANAERLQKLAKQKVIDQHETQLAMLTLKKQEAALIGLGSAAEHQRSAAAHKVAKAKVALLTARRERARTQDGDEVRSLNKELTRIAIELDEAMITGTFFRDRVNAMTQELEDKAGAQLKIERLQQAVERSKLRLEAAESELRNAEAISIEPRTPISLQLWGE